VDTAVLFDFGGTLDADGLTWKDRFFRLFADEGIELTPERFDPVFYEADDALVGAISPALPFREIVARLAAALARALGPRDDGLGARVAARFHDAAIEQLGRNRPMLERLAARHRLGIVSNFYGNLVTVCDNARIRPLFGAIVDSSTVGWTKPDPRIFRRALDELGVEPGAATFVGDSLARDMAGARACGMRHVWVVGPHGRGGSPCCPGDRVVRSLAEVEAAL
jgi:putative hydrolase of the HAD superfamily